MAETNDRVMAMVEKELQADPNISNEDLRAKAEKLDPSIASLRPRQFNATYPLQVKRRMRPRKARPGGKRAAGRKAGRKTGGRKRRAAAGAAKKGARTGARGAGTRKAAGGRKTRGAAATGARAVAGDGTRTRVRAALLDFARDLASADGAGLVDVIAGVDGYVDRVMKATGGAR